MTTKYTFVENFISSIATVKFEDFEDIKDRILVSLDETEAFFKEQIEKQEKKRAFLAQLAEMAKDIDLDTLTVADVQQNELLKALTEARPATSSKEGGKKRKPLVAKYKFFDLDGTTVKFWTGVGIKPKGVQKHLENGGKIEDLEIATFNKTNNLTATTPGEIEKTATPEKKEKK